jgi:ribosomal-protein-alanine N-acetyltransferase
MIKLFTERLVIRDYIINDLDEYFELFSDKIVMYYLQDIQENNIEEAKINLMNIINDQQAKDRKYYVCRIEDKKTNELIGAIGYTVLNYTPYGKLTHLGYLLKQKYWNKGYATEALKRLLEFSFIENNVYRIHTGCLKENIGSEKIMQKCGFIKEAEFKEYEFHDGKLKDRVEYRILMNEWKNDEYSE